MKLYKYFGSILILSFLVVALLGLLMRYKIAFSFPILEQKNLQQAHSHFAFNGWVTFGILVLLSKMKSIITNQNNEQFLKLLFPYLILCIAQLISFLVFGYTLPSIIISFIITCYFGFLMFLFYKETKLKVQQSLKWIYFGAMCYFVSLLGTFMLAYMGITHSIDQHKYLASLYFFLHFHYNGWFFFSLIGLLLFSLEHYFAIKISDKIIFKLFAISILPAYGLSVLWSNLPMPIYVIVAFAATAQLIGIVLLIKKVIKFKIQYNQNSVFYYLLFFSLAAAFIKFTLQIGSVIPFVSQLAFGFRTVVIAYLHLVLLAFISVLLLALLFSNKILSVSKNANQWVFMILACILANEAILGLQGIFSFTYTLLPFANEFLVIISALLFVSIFMLYKNQKSINHQSILSS